jgi:ESS family glutamate:Na+ symporter
VIPLDFVSTLAAAGVVLLLGQALQQRLLPLSRHNVPAPVVGGLLVALAITALRAAGHEPVRFDTTLQAPLMIAFFTAIGFAASLPLLRAGGPALATCLGLATALAVLQNLVGGAVARLLGVTPLLGVIAGALTLAGGPATGLAFAPLFERAGVSGAATLAIASAMTGIVAAGVVGGPLGTWLVEWRRRAAPEAAAATTGAPAQPGEAPPAGGANRAGLVPSYALLKAVVVLVSAMALGSVVSAGVAATGLTLPGYVGAMLVAATLRNVDDATGWLDLPHALLAELGQVALALFLSMALMTLRLWELAGLALPLAVILAVQVVFTTAVCLWPTFRLFGGGYEAAVTTSGFCGFMLGTTANAMANMDALVDRYGPAPRAYLVVPMVGGFFIDFTNALVITAFLNLWR